MAASRRTLRLPNARAVHTNSSVEAMMKPATPIRVTFKRQAEEQPGKPLRIERAGPLMLPPARQALQGEEHAEHAEHPRGDPGDHRGSDLGVDGVGGNDGDLPGR